MSERSRIRLYGWWGWLALAILNAVAAAGFVLAGGVGPSWRGIGVGVAFACLAVVWYRWFRCRLVTDDGGIRVHNVYATHRARWEELDSFVVTRRWVPARALWAVRRSGRPIRIAASANRYWWYTRSKLSSLRDELEGERARCFDEA